MTQIPTINVIVSSRKEVLMDYLSNLGGPKALKSLQDEEALLFNNKGNPNFISFEHDFLGENPKMVLKFIDPQGEFETRYLATGSIHSSLLAVANRLSKDRKVKVSVTDAGVVQTVEGIPSTKQEFVDSLVSRSLDRPLFIIYGTGNDSKTWSQVHKVVVHGMSFKPDKGREFTLVMQSIERSLSPTGRVSMSGQKINANKVYSVESKGKSLPIKFGSSQAYGAPSFSNSVPVDYHFLIVDTITDYLRKCCNGANIIVLLPDLNRLLELLIKIVVLDTSQGKKGESTKLKDAVADLLSELGMSMIIELNSQSPADTVIPGQLAPLMEQKKAEVMRNGEERYYKRFLHKAQIRSDSLGISNEDYILPLKSIINSINRHTVTKYTIDPVAFSETNVNLNDLWGNEDNRRRYTFNGYYRFDPDKPTYIFGDVGLISAFLLPGYGTTFLDPDNQGQDVAKKYLHPVNATDLLRPGYIQQAKKIIDTFPIGSSFGNANELPDIFQYKKNQISEKEQKLIEEANIPVFRHNTKNPNVIEINQDDDGPAYLAEMNIAFKKQQTRIAALIAEGGKLANRARDFPITNRDELNEAIVTALFSDYGPVMTTAEIINRISGRVSPDVEIEGIPYNALDAVGYRKEVAGYISYFIRNLNYETARTLQIPEQVNADPAVILNQTASQLAKKVTTVRVATLPFFAMSSYTRFLGSPVIVVSQDPPMKGQVYPRRSKFNSYLTGIYRILGFRHILSNKKAQSEFILAKANFNAPSLEGLLPTELPDADTYTYRTGAKSGSGPGIAPTSPYNRPTPSLDDVVKAKTEALNTYNETYQYELEGKTYEELYIPPWRGAAQYTDGPYSEASKYQYNIINPEQVYTFTAQEPGDAIPFAPPSTDEIFEWEEVYGPQPSEEGLDFTGGYIFK